MLDFYHSEVVYIVIVELYFTFSVLLTYICVSFVAAKESFDKPLYARENIPEAFMEQHYECCKLFCDFQTETIEKNISLYQHMSVDDSELLYYQQEQLAQDFVEQFGLGPIQKRHKLMKPWTDSNMKVLTIANDAVC